MNLTDLKTDCRHFKGTIPCRPHKIHGVHCTGPSGEPCQYYDKIDRNILIIKLGAIGDVIRTTPILSPLKRKFPNAKIFWLTHSPAVVPGAVDVVLKYSLASLEYLKALQFNLLINLDKDYEACALASSLSSKEKQGFVMKNSMTSPANSLAEQKFLTGLFDDVNKENTKSYLEEMFEICGFKYNQEPYVLDSFSQFDAEWSFPKKGRVIGLNTGCGARWTSRLWSDQNWIALTKRLQSDGNTVLFLGGADEHEKNLAFAQATGGLYVGHFPLEKFISLMNQCDLVVTGVTMGMHIALGLRKKIVLFNNIFNPREFELFGLGEILQPSKPCQCFFQPKCTNKEYQCMEFLTVENVVGAVKRILA